MRSFVVARRLSSSVASIRPILAAGRGSIIASWVQSIRWTLISPRTYGVQISCDGLASPCVATKLLWQERPHETNAVLVAINDSLIVMFLEYGMEMSVVTQGVHHRPYWIGHPGEKNLFFALFMATAQRLLATARIAVEKGEQCDLLPCGLEVSGNCVSH